MEDVQMDFTLQTKINSDDESAKTTTALATVVKTTPPAKVPDHDKQSEGETSNHRDERKSEAKEIPENPDKITVTDGLLMLPDEHPEHLNLIRLQIENQELYNWKQQLQTR